MVFACSSYFERLGGKVNTNPFVSFNLFAYIFLRVLSNGFAFKYGPKGPVGLLNDKKALSFGTTGGGHEFFKDIVPSMNAVWDGMLKYVVFLLFVLVLKILVRFTGMTVVDHVYYFGVPVVSQETRVAYLEDVKSQVKRLL